MWCDVKLIDLILPVRCVVCDAGGEQLCRACRDALPRLGPPLCDRCGAPTAWPVARCRECAGRRLAFASARAAVVYDDAVRRLVARLEGARPPQARRRWPPTCSSDACRRRQGPLRSRSSRPTGRAASSAGHQPAERLARELGERWRCRSCRSLGRARPARRQRGLALAERRRNVAGAFAPARESPAASRARRRRLHERRDSDRRGARPRSARPARAGRRGHVRAGSSVRF